ncbi:amidohydrolase [Streptomyces sp. NBC_01190]|uniref:amidohydrolase n=1 Tax=Streptomyces sp. NBC_01190 TaxID=2903767 RepID=UPI003868EDE4
MAGARWARTHLVDAYCHGVDPGDLGLGAFEARLPGAAAAGTTLFDSPIGFAVRRWCPPLLGLEPHCPPARYLARRRELGAYEATRRLLRGTAITDYLVDTGEPGGLTPPKELGAAGAAAAYEIVRLEPLAQQVADTSGTVDCFLANLAEAIHGAALTVAGFSCGDGAGAGRGRHARPGPSGAADEGYGGADGGHAGDGDGRDDGGFGRFGIGRADAASAGFAALSGLPGFAGSPGSGDTGAAGFSGLPGFADSSAPPGSSGWTDPEPVPYGSGRGYGTRPPDPVEVRYAAGRWLGGRPVGGRPTDPVLLRHLLWHAVATGLPLLLRHHPAGPGPLAGVDFLRATAGLGTDVVLVPGPAHQAAAADLAAALPHVYVALGTDPAAVLARAPFGKVLYASGAVGLPELYVTGTRGFRTALDRLVGERVGAGEWSAADGERVAALVAEGNARRVYRLPPATGSRLPHPRFPFADGGF